MGRVVFGAWDGKGGAVESLYRLLGDERLNHRCEVVGGVMEEECGGVLREFYPALRGG
jgi:tRNA(adenine34) deaminase